MAFDPFRRQYGRIGVSGIDRTHIGCQETIYPNGFLLFRQDSNSDQPYPWEIHGCCDDLRFPRERLASIGEI
jgi:hypothetical protein